MWCLAVVLMHPITAVLHVLWASGHIEWMLPESFQSVNHRPLKVEKSVTQISVDAMVKSEDFHRNIQFARWLQSDDNQDTTGSQPTSPRRRGTGTTFRTSDTYKMVEEDEEPDIFADNVVALMRVAANAVILLVFASQYKPKVTDSRPPFPHPVPHEMSLSGGRDFHFGTFQCCDEAQTCVHACCCSPATVADRYQITGVNKYWTVVVFFVFYQVATGILQTAIDYVKLEMSADGETDFTALPVSQGAGWLTGIAFAIWCAMQRQELRVKLGGQKDKFLKDYICYWCCMPCTITQEARQVDGIQGIKVQCCCQLLNFSGAAAFPNGMAAVGQPVLIGSQGAAIGSGAVMGTVVMGTPATGPGGVPMQAQQLPAEKGTPVVPAGVVQATTLPAQGQVVQATVVSAPMANTVTNNEQNPNLTEDNPNIQ